MKEIPPTHSIAKQSEHHTCHMPIGHEFNPPTRFPVLGEPTSAECWVNLSFLPNEKHWPLLGFDHVIQVMSKTH